MNYDLSSMTRQEVFDAIANHLLTQNEKSVVDCMCVYHGERGLRCAAGIFIPDDRYIPAMEGHKWHVLVDGKMVPPMHQIMIEKLQFIHDEEEVCNWRSKLQYYANMNNLEFNQPDVGE